MFGILIGVGCHYLTVKIHVHAFIVLYSCFCTQFIFPYTKPWSCHLAYQQPSHTYNQLQHYSDLEPIHHIPQGYFVRLVLERESFKLSHDINNSKYSETSIIRARLIRETAYCELDDMVPIFAYYLLYKMSCLIRGK